MFVGEGTAPEDPTMGVQQQALAEVVPALLAKPKGEAKKAKPKGEKKSSAKPKGEAKKPVFRGGDDVRYLGGSRAKGIGAGDVGVVSAFWPNKVSGGRYVVRFKKRRCVIAERYLKKKLGGT